MLLKIVELFEIEIFASLSTSCFSACGKIETVQKRTSKNDAMQSTAAAQREMGNEGVSWAGHQIFDFALCRILYTARIHYATKMMAHRTRIRGNPCQSTTTTSTCSRRFAHSSSILLVTLRLQALL